MFAARALTVLIATVIPAIAAHGQQTVHFLAEDSVVVYGHLYAAPQGAQALILAFHQAGANGRSEYEPIARRLTALGYTVLAVDQRAGGDRFGGTNRTVDRLGISRGYCEAAADLEAAVRYGRDTFPGVPLVLWGSSYSAALVLRLAATQPAEVAAVLAFSPASGEPMAGCRPEELSDRIIVPTLVLRPKAEMDVASVVSQAEIFRDQGHAVFVADPGRHGSSMLVEDRVEGSVEHTWVAVLAFLSDALRDRNVGI